MYVNNDKLEKNFMRIMILELARGVKVRGTYDTLIAQLEQKYFKKEILTLMFILDKLILASSDPNPHRLILKNMQKVNLIH